MNTPDTPILRGISIPACPAILTELLNELNRDTVNAKRIAQLINQDVGIAAIVIRTANSPLIGGGRRIGSITDAINMIGVASLANIVHEALLRTSIGANESTLGRFWDSSRYTAIAAKRVAGIVGQVDAETAYTFGLFHDCGIPLLTGRYPTYRNALREANQNSTARFTDIEETTVGTNHAVIGYFLARAWGLSDALSDAILNHHDYTMMAASNSLQQQSRALIAINCLAEQIANTHLRATQDGEWHKARDSAADCLGYFPRELDDIADEVVSLLEVDSQIV